MKKLLLTFFLFIFYFTLIAQSIEFYGNTQPGGILFGKVENPKSILLDNQPVIFDNDGNFIIGFDRDDTNSHLLIVRTQDKTILKNIILLKREYNIQRINRIEQKYVTLPKEVHERVKKEREISKAAREKVGEIDTALYKSGFIKPISGGRITSVFGSQRILNGITKNAHNGIDIAVPIGTPVKAMSDGKVLLSADNFYYAGNYILIDHGLGLNSLYLHLNESLVKEGQIVKKGEIIGKVGTTGRSTGPHLHWGVQWFNKRIDPNSIFSYK